MGNTPFRETEAPYQPEEENLMFGGPPTLGPNSILNQSQFEYFSNNQTELQTLPEIRPTKLVDNDIYLLRNTVKFTPFDNNKYLLQFDIQINVSCEVIIGIFESEEKLDETLFKMASVLVEPEGKTQTFVTSKENPISLENIDKNFKNLPMLIQLKSKSSNGKSPCYFSTYLSLDKKDSLPLGNELSNEVVTQVEIESNEYTVKVMKQTLEIDGKRYDVSGEIYGNDSENPDETKESCVVCISDRAEVAIIPCRHMCLCSGCATILRQQSNKCPICRTVMDVLIKVPIEETPQEKQNPVY